MSRYIYDRTVAYSTYSTRYNSLFFVNIRIYEETDNVRTTGIYVFTTTAVAATVVCAVKEVLTGNSMVTAVYALYIGIVLCICTVCYPPNHQHFIDLTSK